jgi:hypothetical protein
MQKASVPAVAVAISAPRLLHRVVSQATALGAARRALAGKGTKQRALCAWLDFESNSMPTLADGIASP